LLISALGAIPYLYGPDSFARHCEAGHQAVLYIQVLLRSDLGFDVDTPDDLEQLKDLGGGRTRPDEGSSRFASLRPAKLDL
jgi:2-phospho-L-lactate guanylyltransferase (CobY/MobA/RfbA family)